MYSVMTFVRKRADLSQEDFERYWHDVHVPVTLAHEPVRQYRIGIFRPGAVEHLQWDGWAILTYDSKEAWEDDEKSPESKLSGEDVNNFLEDLKAFVVETHDYR